MKRDNFDLFFKFWFAFCFLFLIVVLLVGAHFILKFW